jgi:DNA-binding PadR family transcriptional regulator
MGLASFPFGTATRPPYRDPISYVDMDIVRDFLRGVVVVHVLHHASAGAIHGAWMAQELARHGYAISPGTLYPLLHRLEDAGLLASDRAVVDGRVHRRYAITPAGRNALKRLRTAVAELSGEVLPARGARPRH